MFDDDASYATGKVNYTQPPAKTRNVSNLSIRKKLSISKSRLVYRPEDDIQVHSTSKVESKSPEDPVPMLHASTREHTVNVDRSFKILPVEIQEGIIDHIYGALGSAASDGQTSGHVARNWSMAMRHPRRKQLSDLCLVSEVWRVLVQQRLYRHIKVKGTKNELQECENWFLNHPHLQPYIKHLEVWVPVWEMKSTQRDQSFSTIEVPHEQRPHFLYRPSQSPRSIGSVGRLEESSNISLAYRPATTNAALDEIFNYAKSLFPEACALTIEGGHCKKPRKIRFFNDPLNMSLSQDLFDMVHPRLPILPNVSTLILKGAWNIIREATDFNTVSRALPNLREWHCAYDKPKTNAYTSICAVLRHFPRTIVHLNLCLEGLYGKEVSTLHKWQKIYPASHICVDLGLVAPQLESITYTGRVCASLFKSAQRKAALGTRDIPRLKSIDIVVKNCCREDCFIWNDGTGINNWDFIQRFQKLVTEGARALELYPYLSFLRIRYIDLDSPNPLMNPYFQFQGNAVDTSAKSTCMGVWNEEILGLMRNARPGFEFHDLGDDLGVEFEARSKARPRAIDLGRYAELAETGLG